PEYEIILVNDGSPDDSLEVALRLMKFQPEIKIVDLSRNFGHHKALRAGLCEADGDYIFLIDIDLEEAPELLTGFWDKIQADRSVDVVYGVQKKRKGGWFERFSGRIFYKIMAAFSGIEYPADTLTARLMSRNYVDALKKFDDREYDLWINFALAGFKQLPVPADKSDKGSSQYTFSRKLKHLIQSITSSSAVPLYFIFILGCAIFTISCFYMVFLVFNKLFLEAPVGWNFLAASIWGLGGMTMMSVGVVGIYLAKIFIETKKRPDAIIRKIYRRSDS
ncbi:MAG: glycosyltransferase family 2 protein, partial [Victivallaceae bacterium]